MDDPNVDDSPDASPEEIRRAQWVTIPRDSAQWVELVRNLAVLVAFTMPLINISLPRAYGVVGLIVPFAAIALVALHGNFFTYAYSAERGHVSVAPLFLISPYMLLCYGLDRYEPDHVSQVIPFALAGGLLMTLIAVATSSGLWRRWILSGMIFIMTGLYAAGATMVVNGMFDHAYANADMLVIEHKRHDFSGKTASYRFWVNYLDDPGRQTVISVESNSGHSHIQISITAWCRHQ